ncbi:MAG TPA: hypothetical protein DCX07_16395 [Phycisphaerales bacterium]|nr:hypothetical protein [Phycisphaerales bacterium]
MTSATGARRPACEAQAFTLLELMLALALLAIVSGVMVFTVGQWRDDARLDEGLERFETALRLARADAARLGRRVQMRFDDEGRALSLWIEQDPAEGGQEFAPFDACTWDAELPGGRVIVRRCELTGPSAYQPLGAERLASANATGEPRDPLTFYADGSCDSAVIELTSTAQTDDRTALVELSGLGGTIRGQIFTQAAIEEYRQAAEGR